MNRTKIQEAAYKLYAAGFLPYLIYKTSNGEVFERFNVYPKTSNGPIGGPRWPYITVEDTLHPPSASLNFPRAYIYAADFEGAITWQ